MGPQGWDSERNVLEYQRGSSFLSRKIFKGLPFIRLKCIFASYL